MKKIASKDLPKTGIDILLQEKSLLDGLSQQNVALLTNMCMVTEHGESSASALQKKLGKALSCLLTPEHGWTGQIAEGVHVSHGFEDSLGLPVYSLYGNSLDSDEFDFDVLVIDLQDIGLRCYTYAATCAKFIETHQGKRVIVCDRPNPLGRQQKGPQLDQKFKSLLAFLNVPFQHGKTIGELLSIYDVDIIPCQPMHHPYQYPWISPSPNLPTWDSVLLYPALVLLEGTNISEGRGTDFPFAYIGASELDAPRLVKFLNSFNGLTAKTFSTIPQSGKLKGKLCNGAQISITNNQSFEALDLGFELIRFMKDNYPHFKWTPMNDGYFIDALLGTDSFRLSLAHP